MASLFGSKSSSTTTTNPFSGIYKNWADQLGGNLIGRLGRNVPQYGGQLSATPNANLQNAFSTINGYTNNENLNKFASGDFLDPKSNPYAMSGYNMATEGMLKNFGILDDKIKGNFNRSGSFNSSMKTAAQMRNSADTKKVISDFGNQYFGNLYNTGFNNFLQANQMRSSLAENALKAGQLEQQNSQDVLDRDYKEWLRQQGVADNDIQLILQYLNTVKNPSQTTTQKTAGLFG